MKRSNLLFLTAIVSLSVSCSKTGVKDSSGSLLNNSITNGLPSAAGDVVGKVVVGYQGWFTCIGDGAPSNNWWHWSATEHLAPSPTNEIIQFWPDVRQYTTTYQTGYANLGNGQPAKLFSSYDQQVVNTHFLWMQQNGIDAAALQRFNDNTSTRNGMATKVMNAAQTYGRKFYIMYDISNWTTFNTDIPTDWQNVIVNTLHLTSSSAYAHQNGKPVVCIWGMGFTSRPGDATQCLAVINFFKNAGCYVIGGVPREWRTSVGGSKPNFSSVYNAFNMLSPWMVGAIGTIADSDNIYTNYNVPDQAYCNSHGIDYQPCVLPGGGVTAQSPGGQRIHGDFMWHQFYNMSRLSCQSIYISMFDEYGEGNQIANSAEDASMEPTNAGSSMYTLAQDGTHCSSDYYLRLSADGGKMFKGQIALTSTRPTPTTFTPPASLTPHVLSSSSIQINWAGVTDAPCYNLKRSTTNGGPYSTVVSGLNATTYTNTGLAANTTYYYIVTTGHYSGSESANSAQVSGKTNP
jgi:hypothetical protein